MIGSQVNGDDEMTKSQILSHEKPLKNDVSIEVQVDKIKKLTFQAHNRIDQRNRAVTRALEIHASIVTDSISFTKESFHLQATELSRRGKTKESTDDGREMKSEGNQTKKKAIRVNE